MTRNEYLNQLTAHYTIVRELSGKENACLLLLRHRILQKDVVVRSTSRRLTIAEYLKTVRFRYLPEVYDVIGLEDGKVIFEEALSGETLDEMLKKRVLSYREARRILSCIAEALTVIHSAGFVHRDIKPKNVMICGNGDVKLIDFDAARFVVDTDDTVRLGTAGFAAPEQYVGASDRRTDIFGLGVLLNVMMTGKHPSDEMPRNLHARHIVEKATAMSPGKRFSSAEEFRKAL